MTVSSVLSSLYENARYRADIINAKQSTFNQIREKVIHAYNSKNGYKIY